MRTLSLLSLAESLVTQPCCNLKWQYLPCTPRSRQSSNELLSSLRIVHLHLIIDHHGSISPNNTTYLNKPPPAPLPCDGNIISSRFPPFPPFSPFVYVLDFLSQLESQSRSKGHRLRDGRSKGCLRIYAFAKASVNSIPACISIVGTIVPVRDWISVMRVMIMMHDGGFKLRVRASRLSSEPAIC